MTRPFSRNNGNVTENRLSVLFNRLKCRTKNAGFYTSTGFLKGPSSLSSRFKVTQMVTSHGCQLPLITVITLSGYLHSYLAIDQTSSVPSFETDCLYISSNHRYLTITKRKTKKKKKNCLNCLFYKDFKK